CSRRLAAIHFVGAVGDSLLQTGENRFSFFGFGCVRAIPSVQIRGVNRGRERGVPQRLDAHASEKERLARGGGGAPASKIVLFGGATEIAEAFAVDVPAQEPELVGALHGRLRREQRGALIERFAVARELGQDLGGR